MRPAPGYEGLYEVSDEGVVLSVRRAGAKGGPLKPYVNDLGYHSVDLHRRGVPKRHYVHALVAAVYIGPRPAGAQVRHLDGDPGHNAVANLAYGSAADNQRDVIAHGRNWQINKVACPKGHPYDEENTRWHRGARRCKQCTRDRNRRVREEKRRASQSGT